MESDGYPSHPPADTMTWPQRIRAYLWRATWLKCPVCGTRPVFLPLRRTRSLHDWFTPLDGCPRCGYAYDREPGYFLWSVWALGYIVAAVVGTLIYVYLQIWHSEMSIPMTLLWVMLPLPFINVLFARHAKAYFLAMDHLADPHVRPEDEEDDGGNGGGGPPLRPAPPPRDAPVGLDPAGSPAGSGGGVAREQETADAEHAGVSK